MRAAPTVHTVGAASCLGSARLPGAARRGRIASPVRSAPAASASLRAPWRHADETGEAVEQVLVPAQHHRHAGLGDPAGERSPSSRSGSKPAVAEYVGGQRAQVLGEQQATPGDRCGSRGPGRSAPNQSMPVSVRK